MIALYMDENVEGQITRGLRARGIDVLTVEEDGRRQTDDAKLIDRAVELNRIAFSRDEDFLREAARRQRHGEPFGGVIYAHKSHVSIGQCIQDLELVAQAGQSEDFSGRVFYLPL